MLVKLAFLALAYVAGYRFFAVYIVAACLIFTAIGDNTR
jgi:hypothetical protein